MPQTASQFHSTIASDFDALYQSSPVFRERYAVWTKLIDQYIDADNRVLDLGCGSGVFSFYAAAKGCRVTGIDGAENMVALCEERRQNLGLEQLNFLRIEIPFDAGILSEKFDAVISSSVLEYVADIKGAVQNVSDLIQDNGLFIVSMPNRHSVYRFIERWSFRLTGRPAYYRFVRHVVTAEEMDCLLQPFGFKRIDIRYYAAAGGFMRFLKVLFPHRNATNLFVCVYRKVQCAQQF